MRIRLRMIGVIGSQEFADIGTPTLGTTILRHIIEEVKGGKVPHHMEENLLSPIGMENSTFMSKWIAHKEHIAT